MTREELKEKWDTTKYKKISIYVPFRDADTGELLSSEEDDTECYKLDNLCHEDGEIWFIYKNLKSGQSFTITERVLKKFEEMKYLKIIE